MTTSLIPGRLCSVYTQPPMFTATPRFDNHFNDFVNYRGRNLMRLHYLRLLADTEAREMERRSTLAGAILILSILTLAIWL